MNKFKEIHISGLDIQKTKPPLAPSGLRRMYWKLSAWPSAAWRRIFQQEQRCPRRTRWRNAWVEGSHIVVECLLEEIDQYHLADLKDDVKNTNRKFLERAAKPAPEKRPLKEQQAERKRAAGTARPTEV